MDTIRNSEKDFYQTLREICENRAHNNLDVFPDVIEKARRLETEAAAKNIMLYADLIKREKHPAQQDEAAAVAAAHLAAQKRVRQAKAEQTRLNVLAAVEFTGSLLIGTGIILKLCTGMHTELLTLVGLAIFATAVIGLTKGCKR